MPLSGIENKKHYVYMVVHPITHELYYIGCTSNLKERTKQHKFSNVDKGNKYSKFMIETHKSGIIPKIVILGIYENYSLARKMEKYFVRMRKPFYNTKLK